MARFGPIATFAIAICFIGQSQGAQYLGKLLGKLSELHHGVSGEVYAVDGRTLYIKDFTYDGQGPAAYFYASTNKAADKNGFRLRDENGSGEVIRRYRKEGVTLTLPEGKTLSNIKIFYVWCEEFDVNFGDVKIPRAFDYPRPQKLEPLEGVHSISSDNIVIVDAQTLLVPNLSYDGEAPDAKFWVGPGTKPSPQGIRVPDENGKEIPLRRYDKKTVVLTLPGDLTVFDIGHFGIWCEQFTVDFGHVVIPHSLNIPPSLKMLGVSPQSKLNCEVLHDDLAFEVRWAVAGESIVLQLVAKLDDREYMSFGPSGDDSSSIMIGGDVVVAWVDKKTLKGYAEDYYLDDKSQCSGPTGSCPDNRLKDNSNNIRLLNAAMVNGYSIVTYQRPLKPSDQFDRQIYTNHSQAIIWAIGPLNQRNEVSFHSSYLKQNSFIDFGRPAKWNCPMPENEQPPMIPVRATLRPKVTQEVEQEYEELVKPTTSAPKRANGNGRRRGSVRGNARIPEESFDDSENSASRTKEQSHPRKRVPQRDAGTAVKSVPPPTPVKKRDAWDIPPIQCYEPEDGVFYAQMGPTGGKRGYPAITGHVGWGISWYINGLLIPEINVVRGKMYTFVVEGGLDPEVSAKYHPFYITDDPIGGYGYKTPEERQKIRNFAGVRIVKDGSVVPTGTGRLCHWTQTGDLDADDFQSFGAYQRTLELKCDQGEPGVIQWTPDADTPDTVYYQCFTHRHLGWKINVHDHCDEQAAASESRITVVAAPAEFSEKSDKDLDESPSIRIETRVKPNTITKEVKEDLKFKNTISEKEIDPKPHPDPRPTNEQLPNEPILTRPKQTFYNPIHQRTGPPFHMHDINPYYLEQLHHIEHNTRYFRPSTPIDTIYGSTSSHTELAHFPMSTTTSTTTTETPLTTQNLPQVTDSVAIATAELNETYLLPPPAILPKFNDNVPHRRPIHYRYPMQMVMKMRPPAPIRNFGLQKIPYKKQVIRAPLRIHAPRLPHYDSDNKFAINTAQRPLATQIVVTQSYPPITKSPPIHAQMIRIAENNRTEEIRNVEVSAQQPSTEREPEIQTAPSTAAIDISPIAFLRPAYNTGFKPGSVKIEGGFKPIITREFQDRIDVDEPEIGVESEKGVVEHEGKYEYKPFHVFEPVFVPSPTFKPLKEKRVKVPKRPMSKKRQQYMKIVLKHPRSMRASEDEQVAAAAERVESYYLPPTNQKPVDRVREPSNIDIESEPDLDIDSPPDVVVTYDGKKVSGQSLTAKLSDRSSLLDRRISKASAFITGRPQFGQFKGELPPLNIDFIDKNAPQLQASVGVLNRDLDTPPLPTETRLPQGSTRLARVGGARNKRAAHHTPEHTAQQEEEKRRNGTQNGSSRTATVSSDVLAQGVRNKRAAHHTPEHTAQQEEEKRRNSTQNGTYKSASVSSDVLAQGKRNKRAAHHTPEHTAQQEEEKRRNSTQNGFSRSATISSHVLAQGVRNKRRAHHTPEHTAQQEEEKRRNSTQNSSSGSVTVSSDMLAQGVRNKRAAHHTPEHTAQQEEEKRRNGTQNDPSGSATVSSDVWMILFLTLCVERFAYIRQL